MKKYRPVIGSSTVTVLGLYDIGFKDGYHSGVPTSREHTTICS